MTDDLNITYVKGSVEVEGQASVSIGLEGSGFLLDLLL
jgi:hypothetical protein